MQNDKAFFAVLFQADRLHQALADTGPVTRQFQIHMSAVKAFLAMVAAGSGRRRIEVPAMGALESLVDLPDSGHGLLQVKQNCGKILGLKLIKGKYGTQVQ